MRVLVVYFSFTGNNRLLAAELARRLGGDLCAVVEKRRRTILTIMLDMMFRRTPAIEPLRFAPADYDHTVLVAPVWGSRIASPMRALVEREKNGLPSYSFITLCGIGRPAQREALAAELAASAGRPASAVVQLRVCELLPPEKQDNVRSVSSYRVAEDELARFDTAIAKFCAAIAVRHC